MGYSQTFSIFSDVELDQFLERQRDKARAEVQGEAENYILNVSEEQYISHLVQKYMLDGLMLDGEVFASDYEKEIRAEEFPRSFYVHSGQTYKKQVIRYHIPFKGDPSLLRCVPSSRLLWSARVMVENGCICFDIVNFSDNAEQITREANGTIDNIRRQLQNVQRQVDAYNSSIEAFLRSTVQARKQQLLRKNDLMASLGVPIKRRGDLPKTFAIPTPANVQKIKIARPEVHEKGFKPDPTLDQAIYNEIIQVLHDVGKQFERLPSTYSGKGEEDLRDHFLLYLEPRFQGSATGETFNKGGKTDILLRYEGSNVFIAECKFWKGEKSYLDTISQLLGYLTWRDSKAAVVMFVRNADFSSVLGKAQQVIVKHPNYLGKVRNRDETWSDFRFHVNGDVNREVKLATLFFHIP